MAEMERVLEISARKERIIPAEESLLLDWSPILEKEAKGCVLLYLQLQRAAYDSGEGKKARIGMKRLCQLCANTAPTLNKCLNVLEKNKFIEIERGQASGVSNVYIINPLPACNPGSDKKVEYFEKDPDVEWGEKKFLVEVDDKYSQETPVDNSLVFGTKKISQLLRDKAQGVIDELFKKTDWHCNDMLLYYKNYYAISMEGLRTKEKFTTREKGELKNWIEEYNWEVVQKTIKYALDNWFSLGYFNGYPTINAIYGYRQTLVPEMQRGIAKNLRGQHKTESKGVGRW